MELWEGLGGILGNNKEDIRNGGLNKEGLGMVLTRGRGNGWVGITRKGGTMGGGVAHVE